MYKEKLHSSSVALLLFFVLFFSYLPLFLPIFLFDDVVYHRHD